MDEDSPFNGLEKPADTQRDPQFDDFPPISEALITALNRRMPERWPNDVMPDRSIWMRAGQLQIVDLLEFVRKHQRTEDIKESINVHR